MDYVLAIPLLPALAFVLLVPLSRKMRNRVKWIAVVAVAVGLLLSANALLTVWTAEDGVAGHSSTTGSLEAASDTGTHETDVVGSEPAAHAEETAPDEAVHGIAKPVYHRAFPIATVDGRPLEVGVRVDSLTASMLLVVTLVAFAVQVYSLGYMHRDERVGWYYAVLSLFTAAMLMLVLADDFLLLYMSWEVMGLCSYLLIGFWHEQEAPRKASLKAFLTTRVGDVGFAIGLFAMYRAAGSFGFDAVLGGAAEWAPGVATAVALLLLFGAMGKSAQVPLHVWLPDAMAGPTPASALIHAATMVAAGVYLVARALPIFEVSGIALAITLAVGTVTALVGGLLASVQHDIKKVLAYSTISQLGYMFIALGAAAAVAAEYHLITHAFFKSLLFLGAGVIIHAYHTQDMREMGGLAKSMPWTTATFTAGALALAGVFPFSGFWSKDEILTVLLHEHQYLAFTGALAAAFVTAFYVARLWFRVFAGPVQAEELKEGHKEMLLPMVALAGITAGIGFAGPAIGTFLGHEIPWPEPLTAAVSTLVAVSGLALGWWAYGRRSKVLNTRSLKQRAGYVYDALALKLYFDITYEYIFVRPYRALASALSSFDIRVVDGVVNGTGEAWRRVSGVSGVFDIGVIDGAVNGLAAGAKAAGARLRRLQGGRIQLYQRYVVGALLLLLVVWIVAKGA